MTWLDILTNVIVIGLLVDFYALFNSIKYTLRMSDERGAPFGIVLYVFGFLQLIRKIDTKYACIILACCITFYAMVIFTPVLILYYIKISRRKKSVCREIFISNSNREKSPKTTIWDAIQYLLHKNTENAELSRIHDRTKTLQPRNVEGFIYISCTTQKYREAIIHLLKSGECLLTVYESDPGHINNGRILLDVSPIFPFINNWEISKRKEFIVSYEEIDKIPQFIDILFMEYYNCKENYHLKAEALVY